MSVLGERDALLIKQVDQGVRCPWNWSWQKVVGKVKVREGQEITFRIGDVFNKIHRPGMARCRLCYKDINYGNKGSHALLAHCGTDMHKNKVSTIATNQSVASCLLSERESQAAQPSQRPSTSQGPEKVRQQVCVPVAPINRIANAEVGVAGLLVQAASQAGVGCGGTAW